jgi:hypothetical protein
MLPRLREWLALARWLFGGVWVTLAVIAAGLFGTLKRRTPYIASLQVFVVGYGLLHWLVPLNVYDRYLLPLVPLWAVLAGVGLVQAGGRRPYRSQFVRWGAVTLLMLSALPGAWRAANGTLPVGGDKGEHDGIIALADYLNNREFGAIVYDRWLGWELNYYLGGWSDKRRAYYPTPGQMTTDPEFYAPDVAPRYFPAPRTANATPWLASLERAGFTACVGYESENFVVYVLSRPSERGAAALARAACRRP